MSEKVRDNLFFFGWTISIIATFGSLYFSEIRQFIPCELCWYQRILMYPLTILLGVGYIRKDWTMSLYASIIAGIGMGLAAFHYSLQKLPIMESVDFCRGVACSDAYINWFGFITIPFLSLVAFILIFIINIVLWKQTKGGN